jgi:hypothetical protein
MSRFPAAGRPLWALAIPLIVASAAHAQQPAARPASSRPAAAEAATCKLYALSDLGADPDLGKWVAETVPEVVQPGTWSHTGGKHTLRYYAPGKVLVVQHTAAAHVQVDTFLKGLKKALPAGNGPAATPARDAAVVPATASAPGPLKVVDPAGPDRSTYPVPRAGQQPKHLFHFIIRYEGEGIIDANVVEMLKTQQGDNSAKVTSCRPGEPISGTTLPAAPSEYAAHPGFTAPPAPPSTPAASFPGLPPARQMPSADAP